MNSATNVDRVRFGTSGIRGRVDEAITPELMVRVGRAVAADAEDVVVGRDGRVSGEALLDALVTGIVAGGSNVERIGIVPTPTLAFASRDRYGAMVTASHNPPADNGIKLFVDGRAVPRSMERRVEDRIRDGSAPERSDCGTTTRHHALERYRDWVVEYVMDVTGGTDDLGVAIDCGCGTGGLVAPDVLRATHATVRTLNGTVDGRFPARPSKPTADTVGTLRRFVADGPVEVGFAFDGDADRLVVVDEAGDVVHEDTIVALLAAFYVRRSNRSDPVVVTTPNASSRIDDRVEAHGGRVERTSLGGLQGGIADARTDGTDDTDVVFAAEPWKHVHPAFGGWIDGIVSAAVIARLLAAEGLSTRRSAIREQPYEKTSVACPTDRQEAAMAALADPLAAAFSPESVSTEHGIRLSLPDGWLLARPSGTEPKIRLYAESQRAEEIIERAEDVVTAVVEDV